MFIFAGNIPEMTNTRSRNTETLIYAVLWATVAGLYLLGAMRHRATTSEDLVDVSVVTGMVRTVVPLFILFLVNNNLLIPRLLLRNRWLTYVAVTACALLVLGYYQYYDFTLMEITMRRGHAPGPPPGYRPLVPMPVLLDFTYGLLVIGGNLAITLMFRRYDDRLERESLMKANAQNQLAYLKAQINPHFYMNMLNNIHGLIDIDPEKAQMMLIDMSKLMRYMLYDSSKPLIPLADEISFLENYLELMRQRYPADRVAVTWDFPSPTKTSGITLPPLLFLSFIENAFKHGVSYREPSYIAVNIEIGGNFLKFGCMNSMSETTAEKMRDDSSGIGLVNVKERLRLLYGDNADLRISHDVTQYVVSLTIPIHDNTYTDN